MSDDALATYREGQAMAVAIQDSVVEMARGFPGVDPWVVVGRIGAALYDGSLALADVESFARRAFMREVSGR